ncbi:MAG: phosphotransferase, partial [Pseudomonadota bacterium]
MTAVLTQALPLWGLDGSEATLIAARENAVYRVEGPDGPVALRLHRSGYRTAAELRSELQWMDAVRQGGLMVPEPVLALDGALLHEVDGVQVDVLAWLSGT